MWRHKREFTRGSVTFGNVLLMETEWTDLEEPHERLRWARIRAGFVTQAAAAQSLGMNSTTYSAYERSPDMSKSIAMDHQAAIRFGRKFKVSWQWLLVREGTPFSGATSEAQERVLQQMATAPEEEQERIAAVVEAMRRTGTEG